MPPVHLPTLCLLTLCLTAACDEGRPSPATLSDQPLPLARAALADHPAGRVELATPDGRRLTVRVEVAATPERRTAGLMNRTHLAPGSGMLFDLATSGRHPFWMKNTPIPLDLLFIDEEGRVNGCHQRAAPGSLETIRGDEPYRYVLEVGAGFCERYRPAGAMVTFAGLPAEG